MPQSPQHRPLVQSTRTKYVFLIEFLVRNTTMAAVQKLDAG
jgi:hypothetical protein